MNQELTPLYKMLPKVVDREEVRAAMQIRDDALLANNSQWLAAVSPTREEYNVRRAELTSALKKLEEEHEEEKRKIWAPFDSKAQGIHSAFLSIVEKAYDEFQKEERAKDPE